MGGAQGGQAREGGSSACPGAALPAAEGQGSGRRPEQVCGRGSVLVFFFFIIKKICHRTIRFIIYFLLIFLF